MLPTINQRTIREWESELDRSRGPCPIPLDLPLLDRLRQRGREIVNSAGEQPPWLRHSAAKPLQAEAEEALDLFRLIQRELLSYEARTVDVVPLSLLDRLISDGQTRLAEAEENRQCVQMSFALAELLRPVADSLLTCFEIPATRLRPVVDHGQRLGTMPKIVPQYLRPGFSLQRLFEAEGMPDAWFYASAVQRARWIAGIVKSAASVAGHSSESLFLATLFADAGLLVLSATSARAPLQPVSPSSPDYPRHPEISAALLAGIVDGSPQWSLLAGQHHERLDGTGFPRRLMGGELSPAARMLTAVVRWTDLLQSATAPTTTELIAAAATTLWRETQSGLFDADIVSQILSLVQPGLPVAARQAVQNGTRLILHPPQALAGPHQKTSVEAVTVQRMDSVPSQATTDPAQPSPVPLGPVKSPHREVLRRGSTPTPKPRLASARK